MGMSEGMGGITPVYNLDGNRNDGFSEGGWIWLIFLFALLGWGGNGFGGGFGGGAAGVSALNGISNDFIYSNLTNQMGRLSDQNTFISNSIQQGISNLGYENLSNFKDLPEQPIIDKVFYKGNKEIKMFKLFNKFKLHFKY